MKIRQALGGSLLAAITFALSCGNDSAPEGNDGGQADTERCGDGRCGENENRVTCPSDCARAGSSGAGSAGVASGGKGGRGGSAGKGGEAGGEEAGAGAEAAVSGDAGAGVDVGSGGRGGRGGGSGGGSGGRNPSAGSGGSSVQEEAGAAGEAGAGGESNQPRAELGAPCESDADCIETLDCLRPDAIDAGSPPRGLCTHACVENSECSAYVSGGYCLGFGGQGFCVDDCVLGAAGAPKCAERPDFGCGPILLPSGTECEEISGQGCADDEVCLPPGLCGVIASGCIPFCRGDFDCPGAFCNHSTGFCQAEAPPGLPLGSECEPGTPDPCNGHCLGVHDDVGECQTLCIFSESNTGCGWSGVGPAAGACLFDSVFVNPGDVALGDMGICASLCDCNDDCAADGLYCMDDLGPVVPQIWGRKGYCRSLSDNESVDASLSECLVTGSAGN